MTRSANCGFWWKKPLAVVASGFAAVCVVSLVILFFKTKSIPSRQLLFEKITLDGRGYTIYLVGPADAHPRYNFLDTVASTNQTILVLTHENGSKTTNEVKFGPLWRGYPGFSWVIRVGAEIHSANSFRVDHVSNQRYGKRVGNLMIPVPPLSSSRHFTSGEVLIDTNKIEWFWSNLQ